MAGDTFELKRIQVDRDVAWSTGAYSDTLYELKDQDENILHILCGNHSRTGKLMESSKIVEFLGHVFDLNAPVTEALFDIKLHGSSGILKF